MCYVIKYLNLKYNKNIVNQSKWQVLIRCNSVSMESKFAGRFQLKSFFINHSIDLTLFYKTIKSVSHKKKPQNDEMKYSDPTTNRTRKKINEIHTFIN